MAKPLRVLHVVPALFRKEGGVLGGAERYALELAKNMARVTPTRLITFGPRSERLREGELDITVFRAVHHVRGNRLNPLSPALLPAIATADIVHFHQKHLLGTTLGAAAGRLLGKAIFVTNLGGGGWDLSAFISTDFLFHGELHLSEYSRRLARQENRARARVILGGVDSERFRPAPDFPTQPRMLFVGRWLPHKGIDTLIEAVDSSLPLDLVGQPYDPEYEKHLRRLAAGKKVRFLSDVDEESLPAVYRTATAIVLPSRYRDCYGRQTAVPELLGQTLLEGMASGLPAVATNVASLPELVRDGLEGFLVAPGEAAQLRDRLKWLATHPAEAAAMGARGRARAREVFTWDRVVERCLDAYRSMERPRIASAPLPERAS